MKSVKSIERISFDVVREKFASNFEQIYKPADDSYLLIKGVEKVLELITQEVKPSTCLEIGSGSGVVINSIAKSFGDSIARYFATDINPVAIETTLASGEANGVTNVITVLTNLVDGVAQLLHGKVDLLVSNPPFEPSPAEDIGTPGAVCAWAAGPTGRAIIDRVLPAAAELLSKHGVFLMTCVRDNDVDGIRALASTLGLNSTIVIERDAGTSSYYDRVYHQYVVAFSKTSYWSERGA